MSTELQDSYDEAIRRAVKKRQAEYKRKRYRNDPEFRDHTKKTNYQYMSNHPGFYREYQKAKHRGEKYTLEIHNQRVANGEVQP